MNAEERRILHDSALFQRLETIQKVMDQYYLDGILGLLPYGIGDIVAAVLAAVYGWFALFRIKSVPLTLAITNNALRDLALGLLPFGVGNVIDFFHKANRQNMILVRGFVENDRQTIKTVNKKALQSVAFILLFVFVIAVLISVLVYLTTWFIGIIQQILS